MEPPYFNRVIVISDLHMGGTAPRQIFAAARELAYLIRNLAAEAPAERIGLVINGDFVDFLAEDNAEPFDAQKAKARLQRISVDNSFREVWEALQVFTGSANCQLIIALGNHDLELALPWVREHLLELLSNGSDEARGRITLSFDGAGYLFKVGGAEVLCVHGNEVDTWNITDFEQLRRAGRDAVQKEKYEAWTPNAGSQLVARVMNGLKRHYPFIDLLKPETPVAIPVLVAVAPQELARITGFAAAASRKVWDAFRRASGFLGAGSGVDEAMPPGAPPEPAGALAEAMRGVFGGDRQIFVNDYAEALFELTEERFASNVNPLDLVSEEELAAHLSWPVFSWVGDMSKELLIRGVEESLRLALKHLIKETPFALTQEDATYRDLDALISPSIDFIVAGHTHLARALPRKHGGPGKYYLNTGTWTRLLGFDLAAVETKEAFAPVMEKLRSATIDELEREHHLARRTLSYASIWADAAGTHADLRQITREDQSFESISLLASPFTSR